MMNTILSSLDAMRSVRTLIFCLATVLLTACVQMLEPRTAPSGIVLTLVCDDAVRTKAESTEPGVRSYRENLISWVDFYFFSGKIPSEDPAAWKDTSAARLHYRLSSGEQNEASFQMNLSATSIGQLFPTSGEGQDKMTVLAIANYPGNSIPAPSNTPTFAQLEALAVSADFVAPADHRQTHFMMRGVKVLDLIGRSADLVCQDTVRLERYASKMTVAVRVQDTVQLAEHEVWRPMLDGMVVYLEDGVNTVRLGGRDSVAADMEYFSYYDNWLRFVSKDRQGNYSPIIGKSQDGYYETYPMYMYPQRWEPGSGVAPTKEPDLKLIIPWYREEYHDEVNHIDISSTQKQCYYKVMMPADFGKQFLSNRWYHLGLDVKILGALTEETPVTITGSSHIVYWQDRDVVVRQAEVGSARYLSVDKETWEIYNQNELDIAYLSSHPLVLDSITVTRPYYGSATAGTPTLGGVVVDSTAGTKYLKYDASFYGGWLHDSGTQIEFRHTLNNNYQDDLFDYSPYTITFRIRHADNDEYQQTVKIIQYPAIYISRIRNSDPDTAANHTAEKSTAAWSTYNGFVIVDGAWWYDADRDTVTFIPGKQQKRDAVQDAMQKTLPGSDTHQSYERKDYQWRAVNYTGGSIDLYNIHISVLPADFNFVIGDPRVSEIDNLGYHFYPGTNEKHLTQRLEDFSNAPAMYGAGRRTLAYYYPTEASERTRNMLAPSYRICSKFGGVEFDNITLEYARYRCAAYQEDGFPAGRWRIPTQAEVSFIAQLSAKKAFDVLFNVGGTYWSANGAVKVNTNGVTPVSDGTALLRCVYDTWYWGEDQSEYDAWRKRYDPVVPGEFPHDVFVWGDRPR